MRRFFADTFYWIALLLRRDDWHERVTAFNHTLQHEDTLFTTDAVILEFLRRSVVQDLICASKRLPMSRRCCRIHTYT